MLVYRKFIKNGFLSDLYTFPPIFKACGKFSGIKEGKQIHGVVTKMGFCDDIYVRNSLVHFYGLCGDCKSACKVFDEMPVRDGVSWTGTYVCVLVASGRVGCLSLGKGIHGLMMKKAYLISLEIGNALIDMSNEAIELFSLMQTSSSIKPDGHILTSVLSACANLGDVDYGRWVHEYVVSAGIKWDTHIGTAVVDMYAKCGYIETALEIFNGIRSKNVCTWNALLNGLAIHGHGHESLIRFEEMVKLGFKPNEVTFTAVLNACCHTGLVDEGRRYFHKMKTREYNLSPKIEHYGCLIDLLCRSGLLDEALEIVKTMPFKPDVRICGAILSAYCGVYVLLSNIFASNRRWDDVAKIRRLMKVKGISKVQGTSSYVM
ncbi:hypothetical protein AALP_AA7G257000 [Arabis alpina]|uniref:Pentatricopeptide repeat-containing protein n=1 Tax=Arabis alpina TaxID=50452 RepID=A0A087GKK5_ARAAL|nr:hypothetical protein AALP_AA7G257000 [Arabis alpina]